MSPFVYALDFARDLAWALVPFLTSIIVALLILLWWRRKGWL